jgi:hypothetical protein
VAPHGSGALLPGVDRPAVDIDLDAHDLRGTRGDVGGRRRALGAVPVLRPVSLSLRSHEREYLADLGALVGTPRAAKKLVNLYRLVRIGVPQPELTAFAGAPDSEPYRAAGLLLALVVGTPPLATAVLTAVLKATSGADLITTLTDTSAHDRHATTPASTAPDCSTCSSWATTLGAVQLIASGSPGLPAIVDHYQLWAPEIARFSFHTRPLWARLSPQQQAAAGTQTLMTSEADFDHS